MLTWNLDTPLLFYKDAVFWRYFVITHSFLTIPILLCILISSNEFFKYSTGPYVYFSLFAIYIYLIHISLISAYYFGNFIKTHNIWNIIMIICYETTTPILWTVIYPEAVFEISIYDCVHLFITISVTYLILHFIDVKFWDNIKSFIMNSFPYRLIFAGE